MSIGPIRENSIRFSCGLGRIGKIVTRELKNRENYLEGILVTTTFICLHCQCILYQETIEVTI